MCTHMHKLWNRIGTCLICLLLAAGFFCVTAGAEAAEAEEISGRTLVIASEGFNGVDYLFNGNTREGLRTTQDTASLTLTHEAGIGSLYLTFAKVYGPYTILCGDTGETFTAGENGYVHEFVDLEAAFGTAPKSVTVRFENGVARLNELNVFTPGRVPDWVQRWQNPEEGKMDLILFSTHGDDDQLFFAGLLPYYAVEREYEVLVVYLTTHFNTAPFRIHEILNGLWACGVRNYPVLGPYEDFGDAYSKEHAFQKFEKFGWSREQMTGFVVEQLRRYKPMVAVGHDLKGEYGHAQHLVYAQLLVDAVEVSGDEQAHPETAQAYGVWDVPKTYIHLYPENKIVMNWDQPMEKFDGLTPFEVAKHRGFAAHTSQQGGWGWFFQGMDSAAEIKHYSPCQYGLYRSTVGEDTEKTDMFENVITHGEQARMEEEARLEAERLEAERLAAEEEARRREEEERRRQEEAMKATETVPAETAPAPTVPQQTAGENSADGSLAYWLGLEGALLAILAVLLILRGRRKRS